MKKIKRKVRFFYKIPFHDTNLKIESDCYFFLGFRDWDIGFGFKRKISLIKLNPCPKF